MSTISIIAFIVPRWDLICSFNLFTRPTSDYRYLLVYKVGLYSHSGDYDLCFVEHYTLEYKIIQDSNAYSIFGSLLQLFLSFKMNLQGSTASKFSHFSLLGISENGLK